MFRRYTIELTAASVEERIGDRKRKVERATNEMMINETVVHNAKHQQPWTALGEV
jgi:hypothetical protein